MTSPPTDPTRATDFVLRRLARAVRFRDEETAEHGERVSRCAALIARELGWDAERIGTLRAASALHDIGKIGIPEAIFRKPGPLEAAERKLVESHTEIGYELLACTTDPQFDVAARIALSHHERVDGSGYPHGLQGDAIPIEARVVAVADAFDALTHARFHRAAFSEDEAVEIVRGGRGHKFDGEIFEAFEGVLPGVFAIAEAYPDSWPGSAPREPGGSPATSVLVVEDHPAIAKGLALLLRRGGFVVAGTAESVERARELLESRRPTVVVVDSDLGGTAGLALVSDAHAVDARMLLYSDRIDRTAVRQADVAGADGVISKASSADELLAAVATLAAGRPLTDPRFGPQRDRSAATPRLTPREREIVGLLATGLTGEEIARTLVVSPETVRTHLRNAMQRTGARTRTHLVTMAVERQEVTV